MPIATGSQALAADVINLGQGIYGDGSDGDVVIAGNPTNLARDMFYDDLTVPAGKSICTKGFRIFVNGTLIIAATGSIHNNGGTATSYIGGLATTIGTLGISGAGGNETAAGTSVNPSLGGSGGAGGAAGGAGGAGGVATAALSGGRALPVTISGFETFSLLKILGGGGGGGGYGTGEQGGGGGGGGGPVVIAARTITNSGTIESNGGDGDDADSANNGGGGGGGGGFLLLTYHWATFNTEQALGGAFGNGAGTGQNGVAGSVGKVIKLAS